MFCPFGNRTGEATPGWSTCKQRPQPTDHVWTPQGRECPCSGDAPSPEGSRKQTYCIRRALERVAHLWERDGHCLQRTCWRHRFKKCLGLPGELPVSWVTKTGVPSSQQHSGTRKDTGQIGFLGTSRTGIQLHLNVASDGGAPPVIPSPSDSRWWCLVLGLPRKSCVLQQWLPG